MLALRERLVELTGALREFGTPEYIARALDTLAAGPAAAATHLTAVVGEKGRGKTTLVNRLLGVNVLPIGRGGYRVPIQVRSAATWQVVDTQGATADTLLPVAADQPFQAAQGPSELLRLTTLLDTPPLNEVALDFEERVVAELVHADAFLICVSAKQMLSQNERDLIRHRLLPFLGGDGALVVTNMDVLAEVTVTDEDRQSIRSNAQRFASSTKLQALFLPSDPAALPTDVLRFIESSAQRRLAEQASVWRRKVAALVRGIERELADDLDLEGEPPPPPEPSKEERLRELKGLLESEHSLALSEAESTLRQQLSSIRMDLSSRVAAWTPEQAQHEGISEVTEKVRTALCDATQIYVSSLEHSLTSGVPRSIQLAAEKIAKLAPGLKDGAKPLTGPEVVRVTRQKRDLRAPLLTAAGIILIPFHLPAAFAFEVGAFFMSQHQRRQRDEEFGRQVRTNAMAALSNWIARIEPELIAQLRQVVRPVLKSLIERLEEGLVDVPPPRRAPGRTEILKQARECLALAAPDASPSTTPSTEANP
ncbi:MAG: hypothetical protein LBM75_10800 [Myxococcales bacterium]|nr:hypothetical protein [Myxococcales bacterium]